MTVEESISRGWHATHSDQKDTHGQRRPHRKQLPYDKSPYFLRSFQEFPENSETVLSKLGRPKSSSSLSSSSESNNWVQRSLLNSDSTQGSSRRSWKNLERQERRQSDEDPYAEIYDLLSLASERLSPDSDSNYKPRVKTKMQQKTDESLSLDDIWEMELI
jgi:hypothetical protein